MTLEAFRIVKARLASDAFSGEGARLHGGRWSRPGSPVVYAASSTSLAMLEMLVHLQSRELLFSYVVFDIEFDAALVTHIDRDELPDDWTASPASPDVQQVGERWIAAAASPVLRVPSAIVDSESNYLLNPRHEAFEQIAIGEPRPIRFDPRLLPSADE